MYYQDSLGCKGQKPNSNDLKNNRKKEPGREKEGREEKKKQEGNKLEAQVAKESRRGVGFRHSWIKGSRYHLGCSLSSPLGFASLYICSSPLLVAISSPHFRPVHRSLDEQELFSLTAQQSPRTLPCSDRLGLNSGPGIEESPSAPWPESRKGRNCQGKLLGSVLAGRRE